MLINVMSCDEKCGFFSRSLHKLLTEMKSKKRDIYLQIHRLNRSSDSIRNTLLFKRRAHDDVQAVNKISHNFKINRVLNQSSDGYNKCGKMYTPMQIQLQHMRFYNETHRHDHGAQIVEKIIST